MKTQQPLTAASLQKNFMPACTKCGSNLVCCEAFVVWSPKAQDWKVFQLLDGNTVCNHCGQDTQIKWRIA